ncbi:hypothetical protein [Haladaptatus sp. NG-WS-4]
MGLFDSPFSAVTASQTQFDDYDDFVPEHIPEPGPVLDGHEVLTESDHVEFHELSRDVFERRGIYDATFGYNLARLNLDARHPDAGFRYAVDADDPTVLHAEFTPTTPFCPQSTSLTVGSFRAWNGESDAHEYDLVTVHLNEMHHESDAINEKLDGLVERYAGSEQGVDEIDGEVGEIDERADGKGGDGTGTTDVPLDGSRAPF